MNDLPSVSEGLSLDHTYLAMQAFTSQASSFTQLEHVFDLLYKVIVVVVVVCVAWCIQPHFAVFHVTYLNCSYTSGMINWAHHCCTVLLFQCL